MLMFFDKSIYGNAGNLAGFCVFLNFFQLTLFFQFIARIVIEAESHFTSVERVHEYIKDIPSEIKNIDDIKPIPQNWPSEGKIV